MENIINKIKLKLNPFKAENIEDILEQKNKILIEKDIKNIILDINKINKETKNENIIIYIDGNINGDHAISMKGVLETNLKENHLDKDFDLAYIPFNNNFQKELTNDIINTNQSYFQENNISLSTNLDENYKTINNIIDSNSNPNHLFILNELVTQLKDKNLYVNESFNKYINKDLIHIDNNNPLNLFNNQQLIDDINDIKNQNTNLIQILNQYPNLFISKAAGNYKLGDREKLLEMFNKITNNDLEIIKDLSEAMNLIIEKKILGKNIDKDELNLKESLKDILKVTNINYNDFMNLYILDYLSNFQGNDLIKREKEIQNKNLKIVEAIDEENIYKNYENYLKYNKPIKELKYYFDKNNSMNYNLEDLNRIKELYKDNKEKYPEIFELTRYGSISLIPYLNSKILERDVHGHNQEKIFDGEKGTSLAAPQYLMNYIKEENKLLVEKDELDNFNR